MKKISHVLLIALLLLTSCGFSPMLKDVNLERFENQQNRIFWSK